MNTSSYDFSQEEIELSIQLLKKGCTLAEVIAHCSKMNFEAEKIWASIRSLQQLCTQNEINTDDGTEKELIDTIIGSLAVVGLTGLVQGRVENLKPISAFLDDLQRPIDDFVQEMETKIGTNRANTKVLNTCENTGITCVGELILLDEEDALRYRNFGKTSFQRMQEAFEKIYNIKTPLRRHDRVSVSQHLLKLEKSGKLQIQSYIKQICIKLTT